MFSKLGHRSSSKSTGCGVCNYYDEVSIWEERFARYRFLLSIPFMLKYISIYLNLQQKENTFLSTYVVDIMP